MGGYVKGFGEDMSRELYVLATTKEGPSGNTGTVLAIKPVKP
jgi:hypothetical protein